MPEMDGIQVLEHLKHDPQLYDIPVIMLAGENELESTIKYLNSGAIDFIAKPFNKVMLSSCQI